MGLVTMNDLKHWSESKDYVEKTFNIREIIE